MKNKIFTSRFHNLILTFILFAGIQNMINAQITVINATGCNITVFIGQNDDTTFFPCDFCPINPPVPVPIPAGSPPLDIFGQDVCGETFGWIRWTVAGTIGSGSSPNPGLFACVPNVNGPPCSAIIGTQAFWFGGGPGPITVVIF